MFQYILALGSIESVETTGEPPHVHVDPMQEQINAHRRCTELQHTRVYKMPDNDNLAE